MKQIKDPNRVFIVGINSALGGKYPSKLHDAIGNSNIMERFTSKYIIPKFNQFFPLTTIQYNMYQLIKNQIEQ